MIQKKIALKGGLFLLDKKKADKFLTSKPIRCFKTAVLPYLINSAAIPGILLLVLKVGAAANSKDEALNLTKLILIRFSLVSDPAANSFGWAIKSTECWSFY